MHTHTSDCHIPDFVVGINLLSSHCHSEASVWYLKRLVHFITPVPLTLGLYSHEQKRERCTH